MILGIVRRLWCFGISGANTVPYANDRRLDVISVQGTASSPAALPALQLALCDFQSACWQARSQYLAIPQRAQVLSEVRSRPGYGALTFRNAAVVARDDGKNLSPAGTIFQTLHYRVPLTLNRNHVVLPAVLALRWHGLHESDRIH